MALRLQECLPGALRAGGVQGGDLGDVELGASGAAADAAQLAPVDQEAEVGAGDAEEHGGLLGGQAPSAWLVGLHEPHGAARAFDGAWGGGGAPCAATPCRTRMP